MMERAVSAHVNYVRAICDNCHLTYWAFPTSGPLCRDCLSRWTTSLRRQLNENLRNLEDSRWFGKPG